MEFWGEGHTHTHKNSNTHTQRWPKWLIITTHQLRVRKSQPVCMPREIPHPFITQTHFKLTKHKFCIDMLLNMHIYHGLTVCALKHIFLEVGNSFITHFGFETLGGLPTTGRGSMQQTYTHSLPLHLEALRSTRKY